MGNIKSLLAACRTHIVSSFYDDVLPRPMLQAGLDALSIPDLNASFPEVPVPASSKWIAKALQNGMSADQSLREAFAQSWRQMHWVTNSNYVGRREMEHYLNNAAYCEVVGSRGLAVRSDVSLGFFYIGPGVTYPAHDHPSPEAYWVLSGTAEWWLTETGWVPRQPGSQIYHAPNVSHAMRTANEPLLAFFIWTGDVASYADVTEEHLKSTIIS